MKKQLILAGLLVAGFASAQTEEDKKYLGNVGINTMTPQATLDIAANTADGDKVEGLMIPRITYAKMQAMKANLTEKHDGLMVYVTDYIDMNTGVSNGTYNSMFSSPYFVYHAMLQNFVPFSPSGLTAVQAKNRSEPGYMLASKAVLLAHAASGTNDNSLIGDGSIDMSSSISNIDIFARGRHSFSVQGGRAHGDYSTAIGGAQATGNHSFAASYGHTTNYREVAFGKNFNTDTDVEPSNLSSYSPTSSPTRQIFSVGNGSEDINVHPSQQRKNALIILRNAHTGIGLPTDTTTPANSKPTEMLDVNGNIKVRGTNISITDGDACTNAGTISYAADGNFYGCTGQLRWKKLNN